MILALALSVSLAQTPATPAAMALMPEPERKAYVEKLSKEELEKVLQATHPQIPMTTPPVTSGPPIYESSNESHCAVQGAGRGSAAPWLIALLLVTYRRRRSA